MARYDGVKIVDMNSPYFQLEETYGILVTGGLDAEGTVLDTAEFLDLKVWF